MRESTSGTYSPPVPKEVALMSLHIIYTKVPSANKLYHVLQ